MSNNNNQFAGAYMALAFVGLIVLIAGALLFAVVVVLSLIFTMVALVALERPVTLFGEVVTKEEARAYLQRGAIGAVAVPIVVLTAFGMLDARFNSDYLVLLPLGGYAFGSLVVGVWIEQAKEEAAQQAAALQMLAPPEPPARPVKTIDAIPTVQPAAEQRPFRFASWDDEEELRK